MKYNCLIEKEEDGCFKQPGTGEKGETVSGVIATSTLVKISEPPAAGVKRCSGG